MGNRETSERMETPRAPLIERIGWIVGILAGLIAIYTFIQSSTNGSMQSQPVTGPEKLSENNIKVDSTTTPRNKKKRKATPKKISTSRIFVAIDIADVVEFSTINSTRNTVQLQGRYRFKPGGLAYPTTVNLKIFVNGSLEKTVTIEVDHEKKLMLDELIIINSELYETCKIQFQIEALGLLSEESFLDFEDGITATLNPS